MRQASSCFHSLTNLDCWQNNRSRRWKQFRYQWGWAGKGLPVRSVRVDNTWAWDSAVIVTRYEQLEWLRRKTYQLVFGDTFGRGGHGRSKGWRGVPKNQSQFAELKRVLKRFIGGSSRRTRSGRRASGVEWSNTVGRQIIMMESNMGGVGWKWRLEDEEMEWMLGEWKELSEDWVGWLNELGWVLRQHIKARSWRTGKVKICGASWYIGKTQCP